MTQTNTPDGDAAMLRVDGLRKVYGTGESAVEAIGRLDFSIARNELVCIVGPSGAGKTTFLRCVAGLLPPSEGRVLLEGAPVTGPPEGMAVVLQEYGRSLYPWFTVQDNVELPLRAKRLPASRRRELVAEALEAVGLAGAGKKYPWQLSGGMQQRVAIARAIAFEPHILVMDEPFAAVDAQTRAELEDLVRRLWKQLGVTVLFVTHDIDESVYLAQRVLVLSHAPTFVLQEVEIDLPEERDQLSTRALPEFAAKRTEVYELIQRAKRTDYRSHLATAAERS
ncbi:ABC transporter ATP-binding protein [Leucobacter allii]|uniref:ABC transporter ATP-binding protein n=1 Tax=Leucobacter allii TaxID=2932247 RepID=A0ABY4FM84_9MICO|nr:ABC transporter ATP-binding protein [Leucobacter allii]UOQ57385.1 ABC transporter ATP-binding protein [Leucobacter allii]UOR01833.1 ABC transporter ATP-binding protein [Leucobacter allii]